MWGKDHCYLGMLRGQKCRGRVWNILMILLYFGYHFSLIFIENILQNIMKRLISDWFFVDIFIIFIYCQNVISFIQVSYIIYHFLAFVQINKTIDQILGTSLIRHSWLRSTLSHTQNLCPFVDDQTRKITQYYLTPIFRMYLLLDLKAGFPTQKPLNLSNSIQISFIRSKTGIIYSKIQTQSSFKDK